MSKLLSRPRATSALARVPSRASARAEASEATRERILAAALAAFSERGFDGASTRQIAARAGANLGLLQYHFGSKQDLWRAAVERAFAELRSGVEQALREPAPADERERTRRLIRGYVRFVARNPEFVRIMHDEGKRRGPRMRWLVDHHVKPLYQAFRAQLERAQQRGALPAHVDALHFHYVLIGAVGLIFHQAEECKRLTGVDPSDPAVTEAHAEAVEHLLLGPARKEEAR